LHQEHLCSIYGREHGLPVTVLRFHNVFGPRMPRDTPYAGVAGIFRSAVAHRLSPQVFEDGKQIRDFVHVSDVARAIVLALEISDPYDGPLNIASGTPRTVGDLAAELCRACDDPDLRPEITRQFRAGDVRHVFAATQLAQQWLGFTATKDFSVAVAEFATAPLRGA
jgi:dTDP-L-rhamnose 4-epimerase